MNKVLAIALLLCSTILISCKKDKEKTPDAGSIVTFEVPFSTKLITKTKGSSKTCTQLVGIDINMDNNAKMYTVKFTGLKRTGGYLGSTITNDPDINGAFTDANAVEIKNGLNADGFTYTNGYNPTGVTRVSADKKYFVSLTQCTGDICSSTTTCPTVTGKATVTIQY